MATTTKNSPAGSYSLTSYRVTKRPAMEGYPVDYEVQCPDGTVLVFAHEGNGGPDYLNGVKRGRKVVPATREDLQREAALAAWCRQQPVVQQFYQELGRLPVVDGSGNPVDDEPRTDGDTSIWAHSVGDDMEFQKVVARTAKRTVCWVTDDAPRDLRYLKIPRGAKVTPEWRREAGAYISKKYPGATVWGVTQ